MQKQELFERIEAYLNRTLSPEELQAWEQRLVDEPDLRQSVELHRTLHQDYDTGRLQLRANLREVMQEPLQPDPPMAAGGKLRWGIWIGIVGLAIVIGWIFWPGHTNTAPLLPEAAPVVLPPAPSAPVPHQEPPPIAQADPARFAPNPGLEALVKSSMRSESIEVALRQPANGRRFMPDEKGTVLVRFEGRVKWPDEMQPAGFSLLFFNNKTTNQPLLEVPVLVPADAAGSLKIAFRQRLKLPPGLYYFTLEEAGQGEVLYAGKFLIGQ